MSVESLRHPVEKFAFVTAMNLPAGLQRRLAGRPVVVDGQTLAVDTQLMLRLTALAGEPDPSALSIPEGRAALLRQAVIGGGTQKIGSVRTLTVGGLPARLYIPTGAPAVGPLLVFFHGGGFVFGDLNSHDSSCRYLAEQAGVRLLAIDYRLAPESPFPAAYDDALAAFDWAHEHAAEIGADPARIGVGGDSAGGNLAAGVALTATARCAFQLLIYPVVDMGAETESRRLFGEGFYLTTSFIALAGRAYVPDGMDHRDPRLSPLFAEVPDDVAPAYVVTAGFDPLRDEGEAYGRKLEDAGVKVEMRRFPDQIHGFLNVIGAGRTAKAAVTEIAAALKAGL
ncbi:alpha/beta hydrolase [Nocardioides sp. Iso805N]|uniref:alpha/beta hydrolase n=1 Tax=Nocardioides sp. Iso805N TaxID=1283287 RepID=UPI000373E5CA|nr:alpha/beta hydrolase [Nocardioides sp. Iso805N]